MVNSWVKFNFRKSRGYRLDQENTSHPIYAEVPNIEAADSIFDGITYDKGASVIRQLIFLVGHEGFSLGLKRYFTSHYNSNTTIKEFIAALSIEFDKLQLGFTLEQWKEEWICTAGLNEVLSRFSVEEKAKESRLILMQSCSNPKFPTLRHHKFTAAFYKQSGEAHYKDVMLLPQGLMELAYDGREEYKAILLNCKDESFVKVVLDQSSLGFFKQHLELVKDDLERTIAWRALFDMVRDAKISSKEFLEVFLRQIPKEGSEVILSN